MITSIASPRFSRLGMASGVAPSDAPKPLITWIFVSRSNCGASCL
jgi:hypothetical protein